MHSQKLHFKQHKYLIYEESFWAKNFYLKVNYGVTFFFYRIDTCIVGDDSTCEIEKHEVCKTTLGISSCHCKPGYGRKSHRKTCKSK